jgi:imidazolonepropionase-like amidohydrolase
VVSKGKILAVGAAGTSIPAEAQTIDLNGLDIWPGMIDAGSPIGLFEIGSLSETQDFADSAQYQPELRSSVALRADSEHIPVTRANGVLTSYVQPTGGVISGQGCLITLNGWVPREMVIADRAALDVIVPTFVPRAPEAARPVVPGTPGRPGQGPGGGGNDAQQRRKERLEHIKELFKKAVAYETVVSKARERGEVPPTPDARLEALVPYARGQKPVIFHAQHSVEILDAIDMTRELKLKAIISGGSDAWKVVEELKKAKIPVLLSGSLVLPNAEHDPYDALYSNAAKLHAAGVTVAFHSQSAGAGSATAMRNLPYEAASAVAFGLPEEAALGAVTLIPAKILGVGDQLGSIEPGKRANLVITAGHLLQPTTQVVGLFINGEPIKPESRHTRLYAKYHKRLEELRHGTAAPGLETGPHAAVGGR